MKSCLVAPVFEVTSPIRCPKALIKEILELAMRAPSSINMQPWNFTVVSGEVLDRIRAGNTKRNLEGVPHSREFRIGQPFAGKHRQLQVTDNTSATVAVGQGLNSRPNHQVFNRCTKVFDHTTHVQMG